MVSKEPRIEGAQEVAAQIGEWPSFHDSEIIRFDLRRREKSTLLVLLADSPEPDHRTAVEFTFDEVTGLELSEFNAQNVISSLDIEEAGEGTIVRLSPCYGINGWIGTRTVGVRILQKG